MLAIRAERERENELDNFDFVLGDYKSASASSSRGSSSRGVRADRSAGNPEGAAATESKWDASLLKKVVLDRNDIWYSPPPAYPSDYAAVLDTAGPAADSSAHGGPSAEATTTASRDPFPAPVQPAHFSPALSSEADRDFILNHLPSATATQTISAQASGSGAAYHYGTSTSEEVQQLQQSEMVMRVLDLRNADSRGIRVANTARIIEAFGRHSSSDTAGAETSRGVDTGSTEVQAAILTHRIRQLSEHIARNPRDVSNRKSLRSLVMKRASLLKYFKRKETKKEGGHQVYFGLLEKLGIDAKAVEGEIIVK